MAEMEKNVAVEAAEKPAKKAPAKKTAKKAEKAAKVVITLKKSLIGRSSKQIATANSLGLKKPGDSTVQPDNVATQGKINVIGFLVDVANA